MKRSLALTTVVVLVLSGLLWTAEAWARAGGGSSSGSRGSRSYSAPARPSPSPCRHLPAVAPRAVPARLQPQAGLGRHAGRAAGWRAHRQPALRAALAAGSSAASA